MMHAVKKILVLRPIPSTHTTLKDLELELELEWECALHGG